MLTLRSFQASDSIISIWDRPLRTKILLLFHPLTQSESSLPLRAPELGRTPAPSAVPKNFVPRWTCSLSVLHSMVAMTEGLNLKF